MYKKYSIKKNQYVKNVYFVLLCLFCSIMFILFYYVYFVLLCLLCSIGDANLTYCLQNVVYLLYLLKLFNSFKNITSEIKNKIMYLCRHTHAHM
jgi:hypothetical protein